MTTNKKRYAFIDVQNTETTTRKVLDFFLDNERLFSYLKEKWGCEQVFFYPGIEHGDEDRDRIFKRIEKAGAVVRTKYYSVYKNPDKIRRIRCPKCHADSIQKIKMGETWKCNCDVDMTIDILDHAVRGTELLIFTGDGDFSPLVERALENGSKIYFVSSSRKVRTGPRSATSRFATKLRGLIAKHPQEVSYLEIDDWKELIQKRFEV